MVRIINGNMGANMNEQMSLSPPSKQLDQIEYQIIEDHASYDYRMELSQCLKRLDKIAYQATLSDNSVANSSELAERIEALKSEITWRLKALSIAEKIVKLGDVGGACSTYDELEQAMFELLKCSRQANSLFSARPVEYLSVSSTPASNLGKAVESAQVLATSFERILAKKARSISGSFDRPIWEGDSSSKSCRICQKEFATILRPRHHCRFCGRLVCGSCSNPRIQVLSLGYDKKVRVCNDCVPKAVASDSFPAAELALALSFWKSQTKSFRD